MHNQSGYISVVVPPNFLPFVVVGLFVLRFVTLNQMVADCFEGIPQRVTQLKFRGTFVLTHFIGSTNVLNLKKF
jgi:hypothetical protein